MKWIQRDKQPWGNHVQNEKHEIHYKCDSSVDSHNIKHRRRPHEQRTRAIEGRCDRPLQTPGVKRKAIK